MATVVSWSGDGLAPGQLTTTTAGAGDTAPTVVVGTTPAQVTDGGPRSPRITIAASPGTDQSGAYWDIPAQAQGSGRFYWDAPATRPASGNLPDLLWVRSGTAALISVDVTSTGRFNLRDSAGVLQQGPADFWQPSTRYRLEWSIDHSTGNVQVAIFPGDTTTATLTLTGTSSNLGTTHNRVYVGKLNSALAATYHVDDILITDTAALPGPWTPPTPASNTYVYIDGTARLAVPHVCVGGTWRSATATP